MASKGILESILGNVLGKGDEEKAAASGVKGKAAAAKARAKASAGGAKTAAAPKVGSKQKTGKGS